MSGEEREGSETREPRPGNDVREAAKGGQGDMLIKVGGKPEDSVLQKLKKIRNIPNGHYQNW